METKFKILPISRNDKNRVHKALKKAWGSCVIIKKERIHQADELPGFVAVQNEEITGLITIYDDGQQIEIVTLSSIDDNEDIKSTLVGQVITMARNNHCCRVWVILTNDNTPCLALLQKLGFSMCQFYKNAVDFTRHIDPDYPLCGVDNIPVRDEIELEFLL
ncbi:MAG TPA: GNAT family N-acetyltransferase [bacterium]|nr:GNAT family N-acetyltransferase [bacterium]HPN45985.1 GNAT family N-acetyltransferase [bacterium]